MNLSYNFSNLDRANLILVGLILLTADAILLNNYFGYQFPVASYFPPHALGNFIILLLIMLGSLVSFGLKSKITNTITHLCLFYLVLSLIAILTMAVQVTSFQPIDPLLIKIDQWLGYDTSQMLKFLDKHQLLYQILTLAYAFEVFELFFVPCLLAVFQQFTSLNRLYFMLLSSCLLGFAFYYFWPTTAPASNIHSPYFVQAQRYTGIKFDHVHHYLPINAIKGGLIAMPSFHIIWALLCQQAVSSIRLLYWLLLPINIVLVISCVVLGWHYLIDLFGSLLVILICYCCYKKLLPSSASHRLC